MQKDKYGFMPNGHTDGYGHEYGWKDGKPHKKIKDGQYIRLKTDEEKFREFWGLDEERPQDTGPSYSDVVYDAYDKGMQECKRVFEEGNEKMMKDAAKAVGLGIGAVAAGTFAAEYAKNPSDIGKAAKKAGRNAACVAGIIGTILALCVLTLFYILIGSGLGDIGAAIVIVLTLMGYYTIFGLIRIMCNRTFFIRFKKLKDIHVPFIVYIGIVIMSVVLLFMPIMNWLDGNIGTWAYDNMDMFTTGQIVGILILMALIAFGGSAAAGLLVCGVIRLLTGKKNK